MSGGPADPFEDDVEELLGWIDEQLADTPKGEAAREIVERLAARHRDRDDFDSTADPTAALRGEGGQGERGLIMSRPSRARARLARAEAAEVREEARAVQAQARQQRRRLLRFRREGLEPRFCDNCGYGLAVQQPLGRCPICGSASWRS
jgi:rubrerythrin